MYLPCSIALVLKCCYRFRFDLLSVSAQQDVVLTVTSGEQCFGSRVTLLCTHPDPLADSVKYFPQDITWDVDGRTISFSASSNARFTLNRLNSTASTLSFTVTEEDHMYLLSSPQQC